MNLGDRIKNRYRIDGKLGEGGMGQVYRGWDLELNREVAIKLLLEDVTAQVVLRFHAEAKSLAQLDHPNVSRVWDFGQDDDGQLFLVMEYIKGDSLTRAIKKNGPFSYFDAQPIFEQICHGLKHAHFYSILHRDIKPSNVMVASGKSTEESVKLVDFGLAKQTNKNQSLTSTGAALGSPPYISPESVQGREVDVRSDIYSLGCLFFELLAGRPPFLEQTPVQTMMAHVSKLPPSLSERLDQDVDEEIEAFVGKFLSKDPDQRFQNMDEVLEELDSLTSLLYARAEPPVVGFWEQRVLDIQRKSEETKLLLKKDSKIILIVAIVFVLVGVGGFCLIPLINPPKADFPEHRLMKDAAKVKDAPERFEEVALFQKGIHPNGVQKFVEKFSVPGSPNKLKIPTCRVYGTVTDTQLQAEVASCMDRKAVMLESVKGPTDLGFRPFLAIPSEKFTIKFMPVTDSMLKFLGENEHIKLLSMLDCGELTKVGLEQLHQSHLIALEVAPGKVPAGQIQAIAGIKTLNQLVLKGFELNAEDIKSLAKMPELIVIQFKGCKVSGLLPNMHAWKRGLNLLVTDCELTRVDVQAISRLPKIQELHLNDTNLSDDLILELSNMKNLALLDVKNTSVTEQGVALLKKSLPQLNVQLGRKTHLDQF